MDNSKTTPKNHIACEDDVCLLGAEENAETQGAGAWLNVFCPQDSCEYTSPTQLP